MKRIKLPAILGMATLLGIILMAADHIDAPAVTGTAADITDFYAFESPENPNNMVLVCNTQGLLSPSATGGASFDIDTMLEFNIDNDGDNVEDLVIQCTFGGRRMRVVGPVAPQITGANSVFEQSRFSAAVTVTPYGAAPIIESRKRLKIFAGPRDDPFYFDFVQFNDVIAGNASSFRDPGVDTFAGTNVLSIVVEVPKDLLGGPSLNIWVESKWGLEEDEAGEYIN